MKGKLRKVRKCSGRLVSGTVKFTTTGAQVHATISRGRFVYATGASVPASGGGRLLVLSDSGVQSGSTSMHHLHPPVAVAGTGG